MNLKDMERFIATTGWDRDCCSWNHTEFAKQVLGINDDIPKFEYKPISYKRQYEIEKVVFNPPATIILWADKTKTIVKAQGDEPFDPEKGMAMAFMKKVRGNKGKYFDEIKKWVEPWEAKQVKVDKVVKTSPVEDIKKAVENIKTRTENISNNMQKLTKLLNEAEFDDRT